MQAPQPCPKCGKYKLYRSHSRNRTEKLLKSILPIRTYRCHNCNWRGWLSKRKTNDTIPLLKKCLLYVSVAFSALVVAYLLHTMIS